MRLQSQLSVTLANVKKYYHFPSLTKYLKSGGARAAAGGPEGSAAGGRIRAGVQRRAGGGGGARPGGRGGPVRRRVPASGLARIGKFCQSRTGLGRAGYKDSRQRPYFIEHARSHPNPEAKR